MVVKPTTRAIFPMENDPERHEHHQCSQIHNRKYIISDKNKTISHGHSWLKSDESISHELHLFIQNMETQFEDKIIQSKAEMERSNNSISTFKDDFPHMIPVQNIAIVFFNWKCKAS